MCSQQAVLQPHERTQLAVSEISGQVYVSVLRKHLFQLEACYLESQNKISRLQKEVLHLTEQLQNRDKEILNLNKELAALKEELTMRSVRSKS